MITKLSEVNRTRLPLILAWLKRATMPVAAFVLLGSVTTAGVLFCGCSVILPHLGEFRVEPIGNVIFTYPVPAVVVTNFALPRSAGVRLLPAAVHPRLYAVAASAEQLQIACLDLRPVETGALIGAQRMVPVSLWNDAIELERLFRVAGDAAAAQRDAQSVERLSTPNFRALAHVLLSASR
jgi:hypothetical protein